MRSACILCVIPPLKHQSSFMCTHPNKCSVVDLIFKCRGKYSFISSKKSGEALALLVIHTLSLVGLIT